MRYPKENKLGLRGKHTCSVCGNVETWVDGKWTLINEGWDDALDDNAMVLKFCSEQCWLKWKEACAVDIV